jgi:hypothetical protein
VASKGKANPVPKEQPGTYKKPRFAHTANTKYGMGDYYGTGIKAKLGRVRDDTMGMIAQNPKRLKKPPKSLA